jgi:hypothetical protein
VLQRREEEDLLEDLLGALAVPHQTDGHKYAKPFLFYAARRKYGRPSENRQPVVIYDGSP